MYKQIKQIASALLCGAILGGCTSTTIPELIRNAPPGDIRVEETQQQQSHFLNSRVRWGGSIISVQNQPDETLIEILSKDLDKNGKPESESRSGGRFIARIPGFLEPEEYPKDRLMTVTGSLKEVRKAPVGSYPYPYPVVEVEAYHLWPQEVSYPPARYYDPFYDPYFYPYPYYYYPYWRRYPYYW
jgi:outer membrane lipoprotein